MTASSFLTVTDITRETTTQTITSIVTSTVPAILARAANLRNEIDAVITGVLNNGSVPPPDATSIPSAKASLYAGLSSACLCIDIDATATTTVTYTAPPVVSIIP